MTSFSQIAHVYDRFNDWTIYKEWLDFTLEASNRRIDKALDLATGTGMFAQLLASFVPQVTAIDIDPEMLQMARQTAAAIDNLKLIEMDMLAMEALATDYDLVTCYLDSLCFLEDLSAVGEVFKQVYQRLRPGGIFCFDVWTPGQVTRGFESFEYFDSDETSALLWDSTVDVDQVAVTHHLTVFDRCDDGRYERTELDLYERTYSMDDYLTQLVVAGFQQVEVYVNFGEQLYVDWQREVGHEEYTDRWFFVVHK